MRVINTGFTLSIGSIAVSPCGRWLAAHPVGMTMYTPKRNPIKVWDLHNAEAPPVEVPAGRTWEVAFSPDGRYLLRTESGEPGVFVRAFPGKAAPRRALPRRHGSWMTFTPDGRELVLTGFLPSKPQRWDLENWKAKPFRIEKWTEKDIPRGPAAISPDGGTMAVAFYAARGRRVVNWIDLWHYPSGEHRARIALGEVAAARPRFSPDGTRLVAARQHGLIVWDAETLEEIARPAAKQAKRPRMEFEFSVYGFDFTSDGRFVGAGCYDGSVRLWDTARWKQAVALSWKVGEKAVGQVAFPRDGFLGVAAYSFKIVVWDLDL